LRYDGRDRDIRLDRPHGEFDEWRWSEPDRVVADVIAFKRPIYRQVLDGFSDQIGALSAQKLRSLA
jgi:putative (di)nucleoside polyphosphate hydrolase